MKAKNQNQFNNFRGLKSVNFFLQWQNSSGMQLASLSWKRSPQKQNEGICKSVGRKMAIWEELNKGTYTLTIFLGFFYTMRSKVCYQSVPLHTIYTMYNYQIKRDRWYQCIRIFLKKQESGMHFKWSHFCKNPAISLSRMVKLTKTHRTMET